MEINQYLSIARRWAWLLILGLVVGVIGGYAIASVQTPIYQASTRVVVSRASMQTASGTSSGGTGLSDFFLSDQILIQTYVELLKASSIYDEVSRIVNYPVSPGQVTAEQVKETRIISISVVDPNPQHAADIANAVVRALIAQNEDIEAGRYKTSDESLQVQISQVEEQIAKLQLDLENLSATSTEEQIVIVKQQMAPLQAEVTQLKKDIAILSPAWSAERKSKVAELEARLDQVEPLLTLYQQMYTNLAVGGTSNGGGAASNNPNAARLEKTLSLYQQIYLNLINTREAIRLARMQNTQSVNQIEPATVPARPVRPVPMQSTLLGGLIGMILAGGIVFLIEFLDDTLKSPADVERIFEVPLIGHIGDMQDLEGTNERGYTGIMVSKQPRSPNAEAFRSLRTNLEFAAVDKPLRTILITSAEAAEGKTTVAANLAAIFAQGGKRVILLDCDLRRPRIHRFIGVQNRKGMTDLFRDSHTVKEVMHTWRDSNGIEISAITSGSLPPNPAELLGSQKMNQILEELTAQSDVVIIDSPPTMITDSQVLAAKVDGVLLVTQPGKTRTGALRATREQLERAGAHVVGAVFNRISPKNGHYHYYGDYRYYAPYYYQDNKYFEEQNEDSSPDDETEVTPSPAPSFRQKLSGVFSRQRKVIEIEEGTEMPQSVSKKVLDPAGWKSPNAKESGKQKAR
jgi:capsular exopolysaccharide synthesis family protein